jgi:hypothetical protein
MRITVTLDPDVAKNLKKLMLKDELTFKEAVNKTLLLGLRVPWKRNPKPARARAGR